MGYRRFTRNDSDYSGDIKTVRLSPDAEIARLICLAEAASDSGKGFSVLTFRRTASDNANEYAYAAKPKYIRKAINLINSNPRLGWNYWVEQAPDQNGCDSVIVYFDYKVNGKRIQVSFHTPLGIARDLIPFIGKGRKTRWNKKLMGSIAACKTLIRHFNL